MMHRFIQSLFAAALLVIGASAVAGDSQYYELRVYSTKSQRQQDLVNNYWQHAAVPAYNRLGVQPIGVFTETEDSPTNKIYVLIPFDSLEAFAAVPSKLEADSAYESAAADFMAVPKSDPAYERFESSLLIAFDSMKKLAPPPSAAAKSPWIFELRTYQSHNESKGLNKVRMFNSGEVPLMQQVGLSPVFFARTIAGPGMPNLIYMVSGEVQQEHKKHWKAFFDAPGWKTLIGDPQYKDNVSRVINVFLKRTSASQL
jgi:hypothetical protein